MSSPARKPQDPFARHGLFLFFLDPALEEEYRASTAREAVIRTRAAVGLGIVLNLYFHMLDSRLSAAASVYTASVRFGFIIPMLVAAFGASYLDLFRRGVQLFAILILGLHAAANTAMIALIQSRGLAMPEGYSLLAALILTVFAYTFGVLRVRNALVAGLLILGLYEFLSYAVLKTPGRLMEMNNFYLVSANILGLGASWTLENHSRTVFVQEKIVEQERTALRRRNRTIETELEMARKIQESLIPHRSPHPSIAFFYKPMDKLGGDFLDLLPLGEGRVGVFISDVSGHGVPAAFITAMIKSTMQRAGDLLLDPAGLLHFLNDTLRLQTDHNFVTSIYGVYHPAERSFLFAGAGHPGPYLISPDAVQELDRSHQGPPLAVLSNAELHRQDRAYRNADLRLQPGDKLFLFTDGLTEAVNARALETGAAAPDFESAGLLLQTLKHARLLPPPLLVRSVAERLLAFRGTDSFDDDVCMICLEV